MRKQVSATQTKCVWISADPRRFRPPFGVWFTNPPTPLPPLDPPFLTESFKRHLAALFSPLNGPPRQFRNRVRKNAHPGVPCLLREPGFLFFRIFVGCRKGLFKAKSDPILNFWCDQAFKQPRSDGPKGHLRDRKTTWPRLFRAKRPREVLFKRVLEHVLEGPRARKFVF